MIREKGKRRNVRHVWRKRIVPHSNDGGVVIGLADILAVLREIEETMRSESLFEKKMREIKTLFTGEL